MSIEQREKPSFFDIDYSITSPMMTADGVIAVATGSANYYGYTLIAGTSKATAVIYDTVNAAGGNVIDVLYIDTTQALQSRNIKVKAKLGISVSLTGTNMKGVIFYAPQG